MDEYIVEVVIDNHRETIKTYATSIYSAIDSLITMSMIDVVLHVTCTTNGRTWDVEGMDMKAMREMRAEIDEEALLESFKDFNSNTIH
jgi:midasin (ATPase involved in ribosome maturation)